MKLFFDLKMKRYLYLLSFLAINSISHSQIPVEKYSNEIKALKTEEAIDVYWKKLNDLDQNVLLKLTNNKAYDSTSIDLMTRTALMFEIHRNSVYKQDNIVPITNLSHSLVGEVSLVFWPIILECKKIGGLIDVAGGNYPAYQLEAISMNFYNYSLLGHESKYAALLSKIKPVNQNTVSSNLLAIFEKLKQQQRLTPTETVGKWHVQYLKNLKEDWSFEFIKMSDGNLYMETKGRRQKLIPTELENDYKTFRVENAPFEWYYKLSNDNQLSLMDENGISLIDYSKVY